MGNETWRAAMMSSAVSSQPCGHTVWYSTDPRLGSSSFKAFDRGSCEGATTSNHSGVICSEMVPATARSGFIGDNYLWRETNSAGGWTYYALVGGNKCPAGSPAWCGDLLPAATPQALLFRSDNLTVWEYVSVFWDEDGKVTAGNIGNRFDTPDFFKLRDGRFAVIYLVNGRTLWMIGQFDRNLFQFVADRQGVVDMGDGSFHCSQSFWDPSQRRILLGWIRLVVPGQNWTGAQTIPRQIELSADGQRLLFRPMPGLDALHNAHKTVVPQTELLPGEMLMLTEMFQTPLRVHLQIEISLPIATDGGSDLTFAIDVLGGQELNGSSVYLSTVSRANEPAGIKDANSTCLASAIASNMSTTGTSISDVPIKLPEALTSMGVATACQALCCQTDGCAGWTAMASSASNGCWLKYAGAKLSPGCPNGTDCWSGVWSGEDLPLSLRLESKHRSVHDGKESMQLIHSERRLRSRTDGIAAAVLDVFIDGAVLEIFANGGERALSATSAYATQSSLGLRVLGSSADAKTVACTANFTVQAWEMKPAIFGNGSVEPSNEKQNKSAPFMHGCVNASARALPYCNTSLLVEQRLTDLTGRLTLLEKMRILKAHGSGNTAQEDQLPYPKGKLIARIGLPAYAWDHDSDDLHGYSYNCLNSSKKSCPTTFPASPTMGYSFNESLIEVMGDVVSTEQRAITSNPDQVAKMCTTWKVTDPNTTRAGCPYDTGVNLWGPTLNIDRDPRWGRSAESPTEDPWWLSVYAQRFVQGVQQEHNPKGKGYLKAIASPKHFTAYTVDQGADLTEPTDRRMYWSRGNYSGEVSAFDMMDSYLRQWQGAIQAVGARGVMCSYDAPNGIPSCANAALQVELLQKQWGLAGPIVTVGLLVCSTKTTITPKMQHTPLRLRYTEAPR